MVFSRTGSSWFVAHTFSLFIQYILTRYAQTGSIALSSSIATYRSTRSTLLTYPGPVAATQINELTAHIYGTWTCLSGTVRLYAAYKLNNPEVYSIALCTFVIAFGHFVLEWIYFKRVKAEKGLVSALLVSSGSIVWMITQRKYYLSE